MKQIATPGGELRLYKLALRIHIQSSSKMYDALIKRSTFGLKIFDEFELLWLINSIFGQIIF